MSTVRQKKLITHDGNFHADEIFAAATLQLLLEKQEESYELVRTRDQKVIAGGDFVFDVGGEYNSATNRFDHHQPGGAGCRENKIPYAAFGLVWKAYGVELSGSEAVAQRIDEKLIAPIDAGDNGMSIVTPQIDTIVPYSIDRLVGAYRPTWREDAALRDTHFIKLVALAKELIVREIKKAEDMIEGYREVKKICERHENTGYIVLDTPYPFDEVLTMYPDIYYVIRPEKNGTAWVVLATRNSVTSFENRKDLPATWAGLRDEKLQEVTGVPDALFCHNNLFLAVARSREGALALAEQAVRQ